MNTKLNELAGRAMGWELSSGIDMYSDGQWFTGSHESPDTQRQYHEWNPSTDLNDAAELLEYAADMNAWVVESVPTRDGLYFCRIDAVDAQADEKTLALAMTLCALRVFGIPEQELQEAMHERDI